MLARFFYLSYIEGSGAVKLILTDSFGNTRTLEISRVDGYLLVDKRKLLRAVQQLRGFGIVANLPICIGSLPVSLDKQEDLVIARKT